MVVEEVRVVTGRVSKVHGKLRRWHEAKGVVIHSKYDRERKMRGDMLEGDLALIKLKRKVKLGGSVKAAQLPEDYEGHDAVTLEGEECEIFGWGATVADAELYRRVEEKLVMNGSEVLRSAEVKIVGRDSIEVPEDYEGYSFDDKILIGQERIRGDPEKDPAPLPGDSGGGLICRPDGEEIIFGVIHGGLVPEDQISRDQLGSRGFPAFSTSVLEYMTWIKLYRDNFEEQLNKINDPRLRGQLIKYGSEHRFVYKYPKKGNPDCDNQPSTSRVLKRTEKPGCSSQTINKKHKSPPKFDCQCSKKRHCTDQNYLVPSKLPKIGEKILPCGDRNRVKEKLPSRKSKWPGKDNCIQKDECSSDEDEDDDLCKCPQSGKEKLCRNEPNNSDQWIPGSKKFNSWVSSILEKFKKRSNDEDDCSDRGNRSRNETRQNDPRQFSEMNHVFAVAIGFCVVAAGVFFM